MTLNPLFEKNIAGEHTKLYFNNKPSFGHISECTLRNHGDLITDCYLKSVLPPNLQWNENIGKILIKKAYIRIGVDIVESYDFDYVNIYNGLTFSDEKKQKYNKMISMNKSTNELMIPLKFFFNKFSENYLQMITANVNYQIGVEFEKIENLVSTSENYDLKKYVFIESSITVNYIYLNIDKRLELINDIIYCQNVECVKMQEFDVVNDTIEHNVNTCKAFDYLYQNNIGIFGFKDIHNLIFSFLGYDPTPKQQDLVFNLNLNKKCKELIWVITSIDQPFIYSNMILKEKIIFNKNNYDTVRIENDNDYFSLYQPYINHTNIVKDINIYSFSLSTEENKINGYNNFENIDNTSLHFTILCPFDKIYKLKVYAILHANYIVRNGIPMLQNNIN